MTGNDMILLPVHHFLLSGCLKRGYTCFFLFYLKGIEMKKFIFVCTVAMSLSACGGWKRQAPKVEASVPSQVGVLVPSANFASEKLKKDKNLSGVIAHFDADGKLAETAQTGGYFRQFLGRNGKGQAVVQDFYQDNQAVQTNPMTIPDDQNLKSFDSAVAEGRVIWYSPAGKITEFLDYHNGLVQRGGYYDDAGVLMLETEGDNSKDVNAPVKMRGFYANGKLLFENSQQKDVSDSVFYYENGQKMWHGVSNSETIHAWTKDGKPVDLTEIADEVAKAEKRANELMQQYMK